MKFVEAYRDYTPPFPLVSGLRSALRVVPARHLAGLNRIVLTNTDALPRRRRRAKTRSRGHTVRIPDALGLYHPAWIGAQPYIELFVDKNLKSKGRTFFGRHVSAMNLASTLFHEIGHHIHYTKWPEQGEKETIAERYQWKFSKRLFWRRIHLHVVAVASLLSNFEFWKMIWTNRTKIWVGLSRLRERRRESLKKKRRPS